MCLHGVLVHAASHAPPKRLAYIGGANAFTQQGANDVGAFEVAHAQTHAVTDARADALALPRQVSFAFADKQGALALADKAHDAVTVRIANALALALAGEQGAVALAEQCAFKVKSHTLTHRGQAQLFPDSLAHLCAHDVAS